MSTPPHARRVPSLFFILVQASMHLTDDKAIDLCIRHADTSLDTVLVQAEHLSKLMKDPNYQVDIY